MSRGKKPKKPLSKKTATLLEQLRRRGGERDLPRRFLIVCEDEKSAPQYFQALKKHLNLSAASIVVVGGGGHSQPIQVVERALALKRSAAKASSGTAPFDHVWCVIDGDYGSKIHNARRKAVAHDIKLAISTMCFEYWIMLHFEETEPATADCDGLVRILKHRHLANYQKGSCDFRDIVQDVEKACARAEKLRKPGIKRGDEPEDQNPCSEVYKLVREIMAVRT